MMKTHHLGGCCAVAGLALALSGWGETERAGLDTKLILLGSVHDALILREHIDRADELPFDGYVIQGNADHDRRSGDRCIVRSVFGPRRLKKEDYSVYLHCMKEVHALKPRLTENFLEIATLPGTLELRENINSNFPKPGEEKVWMWFSGPEHGGAPFDVVVDNFRLSAELAREAGMRGIVLDLEMYGGYFFDPRLQADAEALGKTAEELRVRVRECGRAVMQAMQGEFPGLTVFLLVGYKVTHAEHYALLAPFLDGLIETAAPDVSIVDGYEDYRMRTREDFLRAYWAVHCGDRSRSAVPEAYADRVMAAFPVWPEDNAHLAHKRDDPTGYLYSYQEFRDTLIHALSATDRYVWIYSEGLGSKTWPNWWTGANFPGAWIEAVKDAREAAAARRAGRRR
jgi:hypothetical protein